MAGSRTLALSLSLAAAPAAWGACPGHMMGTPPAGHAPVANFTYYNAAVETLNVSGVVADVEALLTDSQACWPADLGNYGPFFIRLAWHCSGTYRDGDGRGGCAGGRQRFSPEADWDDNKNLDHARALLAPIKEKYGHSLSWGDLFITAGTTAIKSMGGPVTDYCFGRIDEPDGTSSLDLGPSTHQQQYAPCPVAGHCELPLGSTTVGLIYLNPEGPLKLDPLTSTWSPDPNPNSSSSDIRDAFGRMGFSDRQTVALIGGGHAFGKTHGACTSAPCGTGMGNDTWTSGFEGPWTTTPTVWGNEFFTYLRDFQWEKHTGPGGHWQWKMVNASTDAHAKLMRLTSDIALLHDDNYKQLVEEYAANQSALNEEFAAAWYRLTTMGGKWAHNKRCMPATSVFQVLSDGDITGIVEADGAKFGGGIVALAAVGGVVLGAVIAGGAALAMRRAGSSAGGGCQMSSSDEEAVGNASE